MSPLHARLLQLTHFQQGYSLAMLAPGEAVSRHQAQLATIMGMLQQCAQNRIQ